MAVGGYDGMHLIYEALKKTGGKTDGDALIAAMKGMSWESPRGPISIDPETRDIVQNIYIRKVEKKDGELYNVEFATFEAVKDPGQGRGEEVTASLHARPARGSGRLCEATASAAARRSAIRRPSPRTPNPLPVRGEGARVAKPRAPRSAASFAQRK